MISKRNKLISGILGISLSVMMLGTPVFAATTSYSVTSGNGAVYSIGSKQDFTIEVDAPYDKLVGVALDNNAFTDYAISGTVAPVTTTTTTSSSSQSSVQSTTGAPAATTETPAATTETPAATTEAPTATTEAPATTTEPPAATTEPPAATTEPPAATTEPPAATTEPPAATTEAPAATSEAPAATSEAPAATPEAPAVTPDPNAPEASGYMNKSETPVASLYSVLKSIWSPVSVQAADTGKTIITLKSDQMDTLSEGEHKIVLTYTDGVAEINFTVQSASQNEIVSPKTGDRAGVFGFSILAFVSGITLLVLAKKNTAK